MRLYIETIAARLSLGVLLEVSVASKGLERYGVPGVKLLWYGVR